MRHVVDLLPAGQRAEPYALLCESNIDVALALNESGENAKAFADEAERLVRKAVLLSDQSSITGAGH